jgi:hypothetical protein
MIFYTKDTDKVHRYNQHVSTHFPSPYATDKQIANAPNAENDEYKRKFKFQEFYMLLLKKF